MEANREWTIRQVQEALDDQLDVPIAWQRLFKNVERLAPEATVGDVLNGSPWNRLEVTLVVEQDRDAFLATIISKDAVAARSLLRRPVLPGLNKVVRDGNTALHWAISHRLDDVALAMIERPDFEVVNVYNRWGNTVLHCAAEIGHLDLCRAILARPDFLELSALNSGGTTAARWARGVGHVEVAELLERAEADRQWALW